MGANGTKGTKEESRLNADETDSGATEGKHPVRSSSNGSDDEDEDGFGSLALGPRAELSDEDVEFLTSATGYSNDEIREWHRKFKSDCPEGRLAKEQLVSIYRTFFSKGSPEAFCDHIFRTFDEDGNGYIEFREFVMAIGVTMGRNPREKLLWTFKMYDINGDNHIDMDELYKIVGALYDMLGDDDQFESTEKVTKIRQLFAKMDINKDGKVSLQEFLTVCTKEKDLFNLLSAHSPESL